MAEIVEMAYILSSSLDSILGFYPLECQACDSRASGLQKAPRTREGAVQTVWERLEDFDCFSKCSYLFVYLGRAISFIRLYRATCGDIFQDLTFEGVEGVISCYVYLWMLRERL
jgi:hypothetical protein